MERIGCVYSTQASFSVSRWHAPRTYGAEKPSLHSAYRAGGSIQNVRGSPTWDVIRVVPLFAKYLPPNIDVRAPTDFGGALSVPHDYRSCSRKAPEIRPVRRSYTRSAPRDRLNQRERERANDSHERRKEILRGATVSGVIKLSRCIHVRQRSDTLRPLLGSRLLTPRR